VSGGPAPTTSPAPARTRNPIRRLYNWVLGFADKPHAVPALFVLAFVESSFFPIPPDVLLVALALAIPRRGFHFAMWCTFGSVLGGLFGYLLGYAMWGALEPYMINRVFSQENFDKVAELYREWDFWAVFVAAFTPIPYKVFTVSAGVARLDLAGFFAASVAGRGARFFLVALVIRLTGERAKRLIDKYFNLATIIGTVMLIGGFLLIKAVK
jgi:membrane protein YqaA with SNARE-associated domain